MKKLAFALSLACLFAPAPARPQNAYITNLVDNTVSVIDTATNTVVGSPIPVGGFPRGVAVTPDGSKVYVANNRDNTVSVIATATNTVVGSPIPVGSQPSGVAVTPDGSKVYVTNTGNGSVSVIATATNMVVGSPSAGGSQPFGVAVTPDGSKVYVANTTNDSVSVIATATNTVVGSPISVGHAPQAFGLFIQPAISVFSAFTAKLTVSSFQPKFTLHSSFTLGSASNGINPAIEAVTLKIGTCSFTLTAPGTYSFLGVISGLTISAKITHTDSG